MQLLYTFINQWGCLRKIGLNFSPYFEISFDPEERMLSIAVNSSFPKDFFPKAITSITAIVGNNGAGKSTALRWILNAVVEGSGEHRPDGVFVFLVDDRNLIVYSSKNFNPIKIKSDSKIGIRTISEIGHNSETKIGCTYYSGFFLPYNTLDSFESELAGEVNISDSWMLLKDLQSYLNEDIYSLRHTINEHLYAYSVQNRLRIAHMLINDSVRGMLKTMMRIPEYIVFSPSRSGWEKIHKNRDISKDIRERLLRHERKYENIRQDALDMYIEYSLLNFISDQAYTMRELVDIPLSWFNFPRTDKGPVEDFWRFLQNGNFGISIPSNIGKLITLLDRECSLEERGSGSFFYCEIERSGNFIDLLTDILLEPSMITARFFDISYAVTLRGMTYLSSGEYQLLNLLSRIYWHLTIEISKFSNLEATPLIILDEAEIGFHPEWQRKYISLLLSFFSSMADFILTKYGKQIKFQIIYTTHSPISLSDMPTQCVNFLKEIRKEDEQNPITVALKKDLPQTFGANVFDLYGDSFFMENGLIGEFAVGKIEEISSEIGNHIKNHTIPDDLELKKLKHKVDMIGDDRIKSFLYSRLERMDPMIEIKLLEERLALLKNNLK